MAGRISDTDIKRVRDASPIDAVVGEYVQLRNAGGGNLKGLCPFHDEKSPSFNVTPTRGVYHCLAGETRVLTWDGPRAIRDLAGGTHRILGRDAQWHDAPFHSFGVQPLLRIRLSRNGRRKDIYATDRHRWFVRSDTSGAREVLTTDLTRGHRLVSTFPGSRIKQSRPSPFGVAHGFTFGEHASRSDGQSGDGTLAGERDEMLKWFPLSDVTSEPLPGGGTRLLVHDLPGFFEELPPLDESDSYLYGWLAGYFAARGGVAADGTSTLASADDVTLDHIRTIATRLGVGTYGADGDRVHLVNEDLTDDFFLLAAHRDRFTPAREKSARRGWTVQAVEATDRVEEVYCAVVEQGHAFTLEDNILTGNCFGCGAGGDVISFVMNIDHLGFTEAVEHLAGRAGIDVTYTEGGYAARGERSQRARLLEAHKLATVFYQEQLLTPAAAHGRALLEGRGFDRTAVERFGVGYAPGGWDVMVRYMRGKGVSDNDLLTGGLASQGRRGIIDRFRNRLMWPIADITGDVIGFGARRLDETEDSPKYLNTPETPIYKKSSVLYGVDRAKRQIAQGRRAVVVEGYTDVMACHLAGVGDAVATCGTSFGEEHVRILRRLLDDRNQFLGGRIVFTFDGDAAGRKAALRAFGEDQKIVGETYVAIEPNGLDPCELRMAHGDASVRELIASHVPLVQFAIDATLEPFDMDSREERVAALRAALPLVTKVKDQALVNEYGLYVAKQTGIDENVVLREVRAARRVQGGPAAGRRPERVPAPRGQAGRGGQTSMPAPIVVDPHDTVGQNEREALKIALRAPGLAGPAFDDLDPDEFTVAPYADVRRAITAAGGVATVTDLSAWPAAVGDHVANESLRTLVRELVVEEPKIAREPDEQYVRECLTQIRVRSTARRVTDIKRQLERVNPVKYPEEHTRLFGQLIALEKYKRDLLDRLAMG